MFQWSEGHVGRYVPAVQGVTDDCHICDKKQTTFKNSAMFQIDQYQCMPVWSMYNFRKLARKRDVECYQSKNYSYALDLLNGKNVVKGDMAFSIGQPGRLIINS